MQDHERTPWTPDRSWADPLIAMLLLLCTLLLMMFAAQKARASRVPETVTLQGRLQEFATTVGQRAGRPLSAEAFEPLASPWDRALGAVLLADQGRLPEARRLLGQPPLPGPQGEAFRRVFEAAYAQGPLPSAGERTAVLVHLRQGPAALSLEAALEAREQGPPVARTTREAWIARALKMAALLAGLALLGTLGALGYVVFLLTSRNRPRPDLSPSPVDGRALALTLLGWFLAMQLSGMVVGTLLALLPFLRPLALPLQYLGHAIPGLLLLCKAEGRSFRDLLNDLTPAPTRAALGHALGGFLVAIPVVLLSSALWSPFLPKDAAPQQELVELMARVKGLLPTALLFLTVAGLAPFFEELLFRGVVLRWLKTHLGGRGGTWAALGLSGLLFGLIHLQPAAAPTLGTLGVILGACFLRARNLWAAVGLHALWNGSVFILQRLVG